MPQVKAQTAPHHPFQSRLKVQAVTRTDIGQAGQIEGSNSPSFGSIHLLEQLRELRGTLYSLDGCSSLKRYDSEQPHERDAEGRHRARVRALGGRELGWETLFNPYVI